MNKFLRWSYRYWVRAITGAYHALVSSHSWCVEYPDGEMSVDLEYNAAKALAKRYHGKLRHFNQLPGTTTKGKHIHEQD